MSDNFDPMTGKPIGEGTPQGESGMNFDPMTGKPIGQGAAPMPKRMGKKKLTIGGIVAGVAVVAIVVVVGVTSGAFLGKNRRILLAATNTFEDMPRFVEDINVSDILLSDKYTIGLSCEIDRNSVEGELRSNGTDKQLSAVVSAAGMSDIEFLAELDDERLSVSIPALTDDLLVYYYTEEKDGYLVDLVGEDFIEALDSTLSLAVSENNQEKMQKEIAAVVYNEYKSLDVKKIEKEEFEIDGKDRKCTGYEFTITDDNVLNVLEGIEDVYAEYMEDAAGVFEDADNIEDMFVELRSEFRHMDDVDVKVYLYRNKLAAVIAEVDGVELQLLFKGGDAGMQNMELLAVYRREEYQILEVEGKTKDSKEIYEISVDSGNAEIELEYNYKTGDFSFDYEDKWDTASVDGNLQSSSKGITLTVDKMRVDNVSLNMELQVSVQKGASFEKLKGDVFDIGNASESKLEDLLMDIIDAGYGSW